MYIVSHLFPISVVLLLENWFMLLAVPVSCNQDVCVFGECSII